MFRLLLLLLCLGGCWSSARSDALDAYEERLASVTADNCDTKSTDALQLNIGSSLQMSFLIQPLVERMETLALNRAMFYSYVYQATRTYYDFMHQPRLMSLYMSTAADVAANPAAFSASELVFAINSTYPSWYSYTSIDFNSTLEHFGARSTVADNSAPRTIDIMDMATGAEDDVPYTDARSSTPYTKYSGSDQFYWWPDTTDMLNKQLHQVSAKFSAADPFKSVKFYGPLKDAGSNGHGPTKLTIPYFDCGGTNKWLVTMTSPVIDYISRYCGYKFMMKPRVVAIAGVDVELETLDINQCSPVVNSIFHGTHKCHNTTECKPLSGHGMRRGGYQCACLPGYHLPRGQRGAFQGVDVEAAESNEQFACLKIKPEIRKPKEASVDEDVIESVARANTVMTKIQNVTKENCGTKDPSDLQLPHTAMFDVDKQFEPQGRMALRLAHFSSSLLQNFHQVKTYHNDQILSDLWPNKTQVFGEVIATVMSDSKILGAGVYFDQNKFVEAHVIEQSWAGIQANYTPVEYFGPYAWRTLDGRASECEVVDTAGFVNSYVDDITFKSTKSRWNSISSVNNLKRFTTNPTIRKSARNTRSDGRQPLVPFDVYPVYYKAPEYEDGQWMAPRFRCDDIVVPWALSYVVPFFGIDLSSNNPVFSGVVVVDVDYSEYVPKQCPVAATDENVFNNTAKCHHDSQYCVNKPIGGLTMGSYECECREDHAYSFTYGSSFRGVDMETEYAKKMKSEPNSYDDMQCWKLKQPTSGCSPIYTNGALTMVMSVLLVVVRLSAKLLW